MILNLVYPEKSDIKYKISKMPDGQQNITIIPDWIERNITPLYSINPPEYVKIKQKIYNLITIKSRLNNFLDLELIIASVASLRELGVQDIHLYTPYFLGARSDRKFEDGGNHYLKSVIGPIINSFGFKSVTILDPHSDVLEACLDNFKKIDNLNLVEWSLSHIYDFHTLNEKDDCLNKFILVSPDAGATKKIYKIAEQIGYKGDIITCSKMRDEKGQLTRTVVPRNSEHIDKDFIIIDDICDGGVTFINIAKELKRKSFGENNKIYLIITHGIFSKGDYELGKYFETIYCTNSYNEYYPKGFIKQLNIF